MGICIFPSRRMENFGVKVLTCCGYFLQSICLSFCFPFFDYLFNETCFCVNGGYRGEPNNNDNDGLQVWYNSFVDCFWNGIMGCIYTIMGKPDVPVWDYKDEVNPIVDVKRAGIITGDNEEHGYQNLADMIEHGDVLQLGFCEKDQCDETTQAITRSNVVHCLIALDEQILKTGQRGGPIKLYQSTINPIRNGVGGNYYLDAIRQYQIKKDDIYVTYGFLLKLKPEARATFTSNWGKVSEFLYDYTDFVKCGKMNNHRYSMSTILRDLCILTWMTGCYKKEKIEVVQGKKTSPDSPVVYERVTKTYIDFKDKPSGCDILVSNFFNMKKNSAQYSACAKFVAMIHQAGGLISENTNLSHVTNESNCWPDYFGNYFSLKIPPFFGTCWKTYEYSQYLLNFSLLSKEDYEEAMNNYYFDVQDYLRNKYGGQQGNDVDEPWGNTFLYQNEFGRLNGLEDV